MTSAQTLSATEVQWRDTKRYAWLLGAVIPSIPFLAWGLVEWTGSEAAEAVLRRALADTRLVMGESSTPAAPTRRQWATR